MRKALAVTAFAATSGVLIAQGIAFAQDGPPSEQDSLQPAIQQFLSTKSAVQNLREARITELGKASDAREIDRLLRALGAPAPKPAETVSAGQSQALQDSLITEAAQLLVFVGMTPGRIKQLQSGGTNPLDVAIRYLQGRGTLTDQALLADRTVLAELVSVRPENLNDGFGSTAIFRVSTDLVGAGAPNISVRQRSGIQQGGDTITFSTDLTEGEVGNTFLISTSEGLYDEGTAVRGARPAEVKRGANRLQVLLGTQYLVADGVARPIYSSGQLVPVGNLEQQLSSLKQAKGRLTAPSEQ